jgi:hypothetical protein
MGETEIFWNPLHVMMERLGIDIDGSWRKARPLMCQAVVTCAHCPSFELCATDFEACRVTCLNSNLFTRLPHTAAGQTVH